MLDFKNFKETAIVNYDQFPLRTHSTLGLTFRESKRKNIKGKEGVVSHKQFLNHNSDCIFGFYKVSGKRPSGITIVPAIRMGIFSSLLVYYLSYLIRYFNIWALVIISHCLSPLPDWKFITEGGSWHKALHVSGVQWCPSSLFLTTQVTLAYHLTVFPLTLSYFSSWPLAPLEIIFLIFICLIVFQLRCWLHESCSMLFYFAHCCIPSAWTFLEL